MIIKDLEKWVHYNCPNCNSDISQEEIAALHCNDCNQDIISIKTSTAILSATDDSTPPGAIRMSEEELERLRIESENIRMGLPES
jgi:predicted RNA-binding Zn-ribbon protein involved in translation (DUF1610 family)